MANDFWLECDICKHEWIGTPYAQEYTEKCPECNSEEFQIGSEHTPFRIQSFWVVILIPNFLLFGGLL